LLHYHAASCLFHPAIYALILPLYVERIPNRNSNPTWLIRQSQWINGKSRKTTLANITRLPETVRNQIRDLLKGGIVVNDIAEALKKHFTFARRMPHGHVAAALGTLRDLKLDRLIDSKHSRKRSIILALITARILCPRSKLATAQALKEESETSSLGHELGLSRVHENEIYEAMDGLFARKETIEKKLARRHLTEGAVVLCDVTSTYVEATVPTWPSSATTATARRARSRSILACCVTKRAGRWVWRSFRAPWPIPVR